MKKLNTKEELISEQKKEIEAICLAYGISTTEIARSIKVAPSTINRFYNSESPNNALGAITIKKIRNKFPIPYIYKKQIEQPEIDAIIYVLKDVLAMLFLNKPRSIKQFKKDIETAKNHFDREKLQGAVSVLENLLNHVTDEIPRTEQIIFGKIQQLSPTK